MNLIVVVDKNWGIGKNNNLLFSLKKDMRFFRETTTGKVVVVGANTFESFRNGALPNRTNIVLDSEGKLREGAICVSSVEQLDAVLQQFDTRNVFVCGGASVYKLLLNRCDTAYVTKVNADGGAELFFPDLDAADNWRLVSKSETVQDGEYEITFCTYENTRSNA